MAKMHNDLTKILTKDGKLRENSDAILKGLGISDLEKQPSIPQLDTIQYCIGLIDSAIALDEALKQSIQKANADVKKVAPTAIVKSNSGGIAVLDEPTQKAVHEIAGEASPAIREAIALVVADEVVQVIDPIGRNIAATIVSDAISTEQGVKMISDGIVKRLNERKK
ncbi:MAG: hypothetical protein ACRC62_25740 [Microcoleus sp.]